MIGKTCGLGPLCNKVGKGEVGMRRLQILEGMHLGPMRRFISKGDVLEWDQPTRTLLHNGVKIEEVNGMDFKEGMNMLKRQAAKFPQHSWTKELPPVTFTKSQLDIKTNTQVVLPILGCLKAAEEFLGGKITWTPQNEDQHQFLKRFLAAKSIVDTLGDNLKRKADRDASVINSWLKDNGFDIELNQTSGNDFSVASILDVLVEWVKEGEITSVYNDKGRFPAVKIKSEDAIVRGYLDRTIHSFPIAKIVTKSGDLVFMSVLDGIADDTFAISDKVEQLRVLTNRKVSGDCDGVIFPMVDYNSLVNIGWIKGMMTGGKMDDYRIAEAIQQTIFRMNEKGAHAKSAVAMTFRCGVMAGTYIHIDKPFILWIERPGVDTPLFAGVFAEDVWKKPLSL